MQVLSGLAFLVFLIWLFGFGGIFWGLGIIVLGAFVSVLAGDKS